MGCPTKTCGQCKWAVEYVNNKPNGRYVICLNHEYHPDGLFVRANTSAEGLPCFAPKEPANASS